MAGLPKKYAKLGFKRGWAAFKRHAHIGGGRRISGGSRKRSKKSVHHAMWLDGDVSAPALISRPVRTISQITPKKIMSPLVDIALLVAGMAVGAMVKKASPIKNQHAMNAAQSIVGVGGSLLTKNRFVKMPLLGVALQSAVAEAKILFPKMLPLAGDDEIMYLPAGDEDQQIEYAGDERVSGLVDGDGEEMFEAVGADDERVSGLVDGEEEELSGSF